MFALSGVVAARTPFIHADIYKQHFETHSIVLGDPAATVQTLVSKACDLEQTARVAHSVAFLLADLKNKLQPSKNIFSQNIAALSNRALFNSSAVAVQAGLVRFYPVVW
uniref:Uncharacterized protein n=1 Tax=Mycena chlorophos TaxID=658473 RepID=A0ABQ0LFL2_MYCCL|nr:predicted protein [Mycena chlorophos]